MLIEFSVSNYRSFREKQTFSMVAAPRLRKRENVFRPVVDGERLPDLLKVAAIYGPNASGKSNLLRAMGVIKLIAEASPSANSRPIPVAPFRFDKELATQPSRFEFNFVFKEQRYQFELAATTERIIEERLFAFPKGKETLLYERTHLNAGEGDQYVFGNYLDGGEDLHQAWRKLTGPKTLFISQAAANSSEELVQLRIPFKWLTNGVVIVERGLSEFAGGSQNLARNNSGFAESIASFLQDFDVPVTAMRFDTELNLPIAEGEYRAPLGDRVSAVARSEKNSKSKATFTHKTALGEADFSFEEESEGTKGLIGFWMPWSLIASEWTLGASASQSQQLHSVRVLAVDELDSSLHPEIVANLLKKHLQSDGRSQLIFSTHDTHVMDTKLLRRDQFWLTERDINGATQLRSIHDFDGRESEDIEKRYYEGRYRGLPVMRKG